ncbi:GIY-YIG nuclease family protein [Paraglaciecola chathamensis]|uniref:GIY-YIG nuclease family protein n=1 Tax=Paraglaciecola chathamensis TaxID=368405 RepID=UPI0005877114|nr:GIY-YIG nuclease family protein [Paraglaciecola chathamensis]
MNMVYCFKYPEVGLCKIGYTSCALSRLNSLKPFFGKADCYSPTLMGSRSSTRQLEQELLRTFQDKRKDSSDVAKMGRFMSGLQGKTECFDIGVSEDIESEMLKIAYMRSKGGIKYRNLGAYICNLREEFLSETVEIKSRMKAALSCINHLVILPHGSPTKKK